MASLPRSSFNKHMSLDRTYVDLTGQSSKQKLHFANVDFWLVCLYSTSELGWESPEESEFLEYTTLHNTRRSWRSLDLGSLYDHVWLSNLTSIRVYIIFTTCTRTTCRMQAFALVPFYFTNECCVSYEIFSWSKLSYGVYCSSLYNILHERGLRCFFIHEKVI